ncbi:MAG: LacI family DNA-binding transcriptional regulator [Lentimonas sp.]
MTLPTKLTGIRLIAKEVGVSTATVSRALNEDTAHKVKESTRSSILELADKMHFRLNPGARIMQRGLSPTIGIIVPRKDAVFESEFYGRFLGGVISATAATSWDVRILTTGRDPLKFVEELRAAGRDCSGLICLGTPLSEGTLVELENYRRPLVLLKSVLPLDYSIESGSFHVIGTDNFGGGVSASRHLCELGHRKIGLILGPDASRDFVERERGYFEGLRQFGIEIDPSLSFRESYDDQSGRHGCEYFLNMAERPTALLCANDSLAFGALDYAKSMGVNCPNDISIVGFDDGLLANCCSPKLTTVTQPLAEMAAQAVEVIMNNIEAPSMMSLGELIELPTTLSIRESSHSLTAV